MYLENKLHYIQFALKLYTLYKRANSVYLPVSATRNLQISIVYYRLPSQRSAWAHKNFVVGRNPFSRERVYTFVLILDVVKRDNKMYLSNELNCTIYLITYFTPTVSDYKEVFLFTTRHNKIFSFLCIFVKV